MARSKFITDVLEFTERFRFPIKPRPGFLDDDYMRMRLNFMLEELNETARAAGFRYDGAVGQYKPIVNRLPSEHNLVDVLDGLVDLLYVLLGTAVLMGLTSARFVRPLRGAEVHSPVPCRFEEAWDRVHAANMRKVLVERSDQSKRGHRYDCKKPEGWQAPKLDDLI